MRIHHLSCGSMCPHGGAWFGGRGSPRERLEIVCHCLLIESGDSLALIDTGYGTADCRDPGANLGRPFTAVFAPVCDPAETAVAQVRALGLDPADVRQIAVTHLDLDHAGGLPDFPAAEVHVFAPEREAALRPNLRERQRYRGAHFAHGPRWVEHAVAGDRWFGFESIRVLPGLDTDVALIPLAGHSRGHVAVAVRDGDGWLLHCGDAYYHRDEVADPPSCPPGLAAFQAVMAADNSARKRNQERLRELATEHRDDLRLFCAHDPVELERLRAAHA
jgi:glyoxylase-like metal-dependent hydrolase (beta-lactamase superfamily II)